MVKMQKMPEKNTKIVSKYYGEQGYSYEKKLCKLAKKITDVVPHKLTGVKTTGAIVSIGKERKI